MSKKTENEARKTLFAKTAADKVLYSYEGWEFWEFDCKAGGDTVIYRVYDNGHITER